jgi:hypothetical protein
MRIEPPPSLPCAIGAMPAATAAAAPPEDPPAVSERLHGLRVATVRLVSVDGASPSSGAVDLPNMMTPARLKRSTRVVSLVAGGASAKNSRALGCPGIHWHRRDVLEEKRDARQRGGWIHLRCRRETQVIEFLGISRSHAD